MKTFPWFTAVAVLFLLYAAAYLRLELEISIAFWLFLGVLAGLWVSNVKLMAASMNNGNQNLESGRRYLVKMTALLLAGLLIFSVFDFGFADSILDNRKKGIAFRDRIVKNAQYLMNIESYGIAYQRDVKNAFEIFKGDSSASQPLIDMSEVYLYVNRERMVMLGDASWLMAIDVPSSLDGMNVGTLFSDLGESYKKQLTALENYILHMNVVAKTKNLSFANVANNHFNEYEDALQKSKVLLDSALGLAGVNADSLRRTLATTISSQIPVEALPVFARVARVCPAFAKFRNYFDFQEISEIDGSYYDGKAQSNQTGLHLYIREALPFANIRTQNNVCRFILTKKKDRVYVQKEACVALCKGEEISFSGHYELKVPEDRINVNQ